MAKNTPKSYDELIKIADELVAEGKLAEAKLVYQEAQEANDNEDAYAVEKIAEVEEAIAKAEEEAKIQAEEKAKIQAEEKAKADAEAEAKAKKGAVAPAKTVNKVEAKEKEVACRVMKNHSCNLFKEIYNLEKDSSVSLPISVANILSAQGIIVRK